MKFSQPAQSTQSLSRIEEVRDSLLRYSVTEKLLHVRHFSSSHEPSNLAKDSELLTQSAAVNPPLSQANGFFSSLQVIGQFRAAYILCQDEFDLVLIDQHAAHERVVFEELRISFNSSALEGQQLLFPETLELLPNESAILKEQYLLFQKLGFELEHFGGNTWLLNSLPLPLSGHDYIQALRDLLEEIAAIGSSHLLAEKMDDILATIACHSVVRGERHLSVGEIQHLFKRMDSTDFSAHCPHGRPVVTRISLSDIEKLFKRT
jgi:DNA mismatch repair protein MutL